MAAGEKKVYFLLLDKERFLTELPRSTNNIVDARSYQSLCYRNFLSNKDAGNIRNKLIYNLRLDISFTLQSYVSRIFEIDEKENLVMFVNDSNQNVGILSDDLEKLKEYNTKNQEVFSGNDPALGKIQSKKSKKKKSKGRKKKSKK